MESRTAVRMLVVSGLALAVVTVAAARSLAPAIASVVNLGPHHDPTPTPPPSAAPLAPAHGLGTDTVRLTTALDREAVLRSEGTVHLEVGIESLVPAQQTRAPTDVVVVMDTSGSMSGDKLADAKAATLALIEQIGPQDRLSLVTFDSAPRVRWGLQDTRARDGWVSEVNRLRAGGSTNMAGGLDVGRSHLPSGSGRAQRVILISDGMPDDAAGLVERAASLAVAEAPLSAVGIGLDYSEELMTSLADAGTGNFHWVTRGNDLASVFATELGAATQTVASGLEVSVDLPDGVHLFDAAGLPVTHHDGSATIRLGALRAEQDRRLWLTLKVDPNVDATTLDLGSVQARWTTLDGQPGVAVAAASPVTVTDDRAVFVAGVDADRWSRSVVEEEYTRLQTAVSAAVQAGDKDQAQAAIDQYKGRIGSLNRMIGSAAVVDNLSDLDTLEADMNQQFTGANQRHRQNVWSKTTRSSSWSSRRR